MAFSRPTLPELIARIRTDLQSRAEGGDPFLRRSFEAVLARALAGLAHGLYGYMAWIARQIIPSMSDEDMLLRWAAIFGVQRKAATKASGQATFAGTNGSILALGSIVQRSDGVQYVTTAAGTVSSNSVTVPVDAVLAGAAGNTDGPATVRLASPVSGINSAGNFTVAGAQGGLDIEGIEDLRARLLQRISTPQRGGSGPDYEAWIRETAGVDVLNVYVYGPERLGPGTVAASFSVDAVDVIPTSPQVAAVQSHVDSKRPIDMRSFTAFAPIAQPLSVTLKLAPNTPSVQAAVKAAVADLVRREATPGGTLLVSHLREAISAAVGETDHELVTPTANVPASSQDHLITFRADTGTISFLSF